MQEVIYSVMLLRYVGQDENWDLAVEFYNKRSSITLTVVISRRWWDENHIKVSFAEDWERDGVEADDDVG